MRTAPGPMDRPAPGAAEGRGPPPSVRQPSCFRPCCASRRKQPPRWRERLPDIGKRANRIGEKHDSEAREREVENWLEIIVGRIGFNEYYVRVLGRGARPGDVQHGTGISTPAAAPPRPALTPGEMSLSRSRSQFEDAFVFPRRSEIECGFRDFLEVKVYLFLQSRPAFACGPVPVLDLLCISEVVMARPFAGGRLCAA